MAPTATALAFSSAAPSDVVEFVVSVDFGRLEGGDGVLPLSAVRFESTSAVTLVSGLSPKAEIDRVAAEQCVHRVEQEVARLQADGVEGEHDAAGLVAAEGVGAVGRLDVGVILGIDRQHQRRVRAAAGGRIGGGDRTEGRDLGGGQFWMRLVAMMPFSAMLLELLPSLLEPAVTVLSLVASMVALSSAEIVAVLALIVAFNT